MGLQGWDASFMFQNRDSGAFSEKIGRDQWDVAAPQVLGVFPAVARHIHRGDVLESPTAAVRRVHMPSLFAGKLGFDDSVAQGYDDKELDSSTVSARSLGVTRSAVAFTDEYADTPAFDMKACQRNGQLVSSTSQLRWQEATAQTGGFFTLDTPGTKGVVGFAAGRKLDLDGVTIEPQTPYAAIYVTARDRGQTIASARELLIVAIARARNTGMKFSPNGDRMLAPGKPPIVMEPVKARLTIRKPGATRVILLDHDGRITDKQIPLENGACHLDGARDQTPYYLVR
jgi:hypothetical protein